MNYEKPELTDLGTATTSIQGHDKGPIQSYDGVFCTTHAYEADE